MAGAKRHVDPRHAFMEDQVSAALPLHTYVADIDPIVQKNRIPTTSELSALKFQAKSLSDFIARLTNDLKCADEAQGRLRTKYKHQKRELEGTKSQLYEGQRLQQFLEKQHLEFSTELDRLSGILHPIRRYPPELLQSIFESACDIPDSTQAINTAICLSHVCQRWRTIAVETPRLWCNVVFSLNDDNSHISEFWGGIIPRIKHAPAILSIMDVDFPGGHRLKHCNLSQIPVIEKLSLYLPAVEYFTHLIRLPCFLPKTGVKQLEILHGGAEDAFLDPLEDIAWDLGELVKKLPPVSSIMLDAGCALRVSPSPKLKSITSLHLENMLDVDVLSLLALLTQLLTFELHGIRVAGSTTVTQVVSTPLQSMIMSDCGEDETWLDRLSCPSLNTFLHAGPALSTASSSFLQRHLSITRLEFVGEDNVVALVIASAPQLQTLEMDPSVSYLYKCKAPRLKGPPFPELKELTISATKLPMTQEDFEGLVRQQCLPHTHLKSKLPASLDPLTTLRIRRQLSPEDELVPEPWRESELFQSAMRQAATDPCWSWSELVTLSWQ